MQKDEEALTEFHKDVLRGTEGDLLEVFADQNLDGVFIPVFRDVLAHEVGLRDGRKNRKAPLKSSTQILYGIKRIKVVIACKMFACGPAAVFTV